MGIAGRLSDGRPCLLRASLQDRQGPCERTFRPIALQETQRRIAYSRSRRVLPGPEGPSPGIGEHSQATHPTYLIGLFCAVVPTLASFWASSTDLVYAPGAPVRLAVLAVAQMGVHLVFFLHISSAPDQPNNFLALAFGIFVVGLIMFGSMIIMANPNHAMVPMDRLMQMQR